LRGFQFDCLWADELAKWKKAQESWDMLQFGLRLGSDPRACVTTTPRNRSVLRDLLDRDTTRMTHAPTSANAANLAKGFLHEMNARFSGTHLGQQELEGLLVEDVPGAFWTTQKLARFTVDACPPLSRIIVAVDPSVTTGTKSDACGIIVAGAMTDGPPQDWLAVVLEDATVTGAGPGGWAQEVVAAFDRHNAQSVIAEVNQGGDLVESILRANHPFLPYRGVHAKVSKAARAEPVAALYEQGRVVHLRGLQALEEQMCQMTRQGFSGSGSPDRVDALVWALEDLLLTPLEQFRLAPQIRPV